MTEYIDSSVAVKWFKDEEHTPEALKLLEDIRKKTIPSCSSELLLLEAVRGVMKSGNEKETAQEASEVIQELFEIGAVEKIQVSSILEKAKDLMIEFNLHSADAVHFATALHTKSTTFWTEDEHFHKKTIKEYAKKHKLEIKKLGNM